MKMKYIILTVLMLAVVCNPAGAAEKPKVLVAVFSRADENYAVGVIEKGNTMILAEMIAERTGADLFEIQQHQTCKDG